MLLKDSVSKVLDEDRSRYYDARFECSPPPYSLPPLLSSSLLPRTRDRNLILNFFYQYNCTNLSTMIASATLGI